MDVVAGDADVVGRRPPRQRCLSQTSGRGQRAGRARRGRRRRRFATASFEAGPALPAASMGNHLVVVDAGSETRVGVARSRRLRDPVSRSRREAGGRRAMDVVACDTDVVGRRAPGQGRACHRRARPPAFPAATAASCREDGGRSDAVVAVELDLAGVEGAVVDADVVDDAVEEAAGRAAVGADAPRVRVADAARDCARRDLDAVDVVARGGAVVGRGEVLPLPCDRALAGVEIRREAVAEGDVVVAGQVVDPEHRAVAGPRAEDADVLLGRSPSAPTLRA